MILPAVFRQPVALILFAWYIIALKPVDNTHQCKLFRCRFFFFYHKLENKTKQNIQLYKIASKSTK